MDYIDYAFMMLNKLYHPYARENDPNKWDLLWEWFDFRINYDYIKAVTHHEIL